MFKYLFAISCLVPMLNGCNSGLEKKSTDTSEAAAQTDYVGAEAFAKVSLVADIERAPIEARDLQINEFYLAQMNIKGVYVGNAYITTTSLADNVEIVPCYDGTYYDSLGNAVQKTGCEAVRKEAVNRVIFPPFLAGTITFKARACVLPARALSSGVLCGAWKEKKWQQPPNVNTALVDLLLKRDALNGEIADMGARVKLAFETFVSDVAVCQKRVAVGKNTEYIRNIVLSFTKLGEVLIAKALKPSTESAPDAPVKESGDIVPDKKGAEKVADSTAKNIALLDSKTDPGLKAPAEEAKEAVKTLNSEVKSASLSLTGGTVCPVTGLQMLSNSIFNIVTAADQINAKRPCLADMRANSEIAVARVRIQELYAKLKEVEDQIKANGG